MTDEQNNNLPDEQAEAAAEETQAEAQAAATDEQTADQAAEVEASAEADVEAEAAKADDAGADEATSDESAADDAAAEAEPEGDDATEAEAEEETGTAAKKPADRKPKAEKKSADKKSSDKKPADKKAAAKDNTPAEAPADAPEFVKATAKYVRTSPRKARLVIDHIRGLEVEKARTVLQYTTRRAAKDISKVLESAVANADHNHDLDEGELYISAAFVDEGPTIKRFTPRAKGRATPIHKRTSHITVAVSHVSARNKNRKGS